MAFKLKFGNWFGSVPRGGAAALDSPTTQMATGALTATMPPPAYDPLATVSVMDQLRGATARKVVQPRQLPLIGHLPVEKQFQILGVLAGLFFVLAVILIGINAMHSTRNAVAIATATEMQMLSQRVARSTALANSGSPIAFDHLKESRDRFRASYEAIAKGGTSRGVSLDMSLDTAVQGALEAIGQRWERIETSAGRLIANQGSLAALTSAIEAINQGNAPLAEATEQAAAQVAATGGSNRDAAVANQLVVLTQRIAKNANTLAASDEIDPDTAFSLNRDLAGFREGLVALQRGSDALKTAGARDADARRALSEVQRRFAEYETRVGGILENLQKLVTAKQAARAVNSESEALLADTIKLTRSLENEGRLQTIAVWFAVLFGILALGSLLLLGKVFLDDARLKAYQSEQENERNQAAILRLLNEMSNLADGDLTVQASVTEDVTGAIADSINFTIEELRTLVRGINTATEQVTRATQDAQSISNRLFEASQRQNKEIQQASASVLVMAQSINEVSMSAAQSARVAQQSLSAAEKGGSAVQNQISGMNEIRSQIQETAKRIKRLGESSLEIGEIVELISDITEQTNVLALNAAIQAASAGEAGRGFSVVAEEVQRLAERSGEATKQIEAIVKTIQADTQDAIAAMERSTQGVVEGTKLSDAAGSALGEIRNVSRELAELIGGISAQTQKQSASVSEVTRGMQGILKITEETTEGTKQTNVSIGQLTRLSADLRSSVSGFKVQ